MLGWPNEQCAVSAARFYLLLKRRYLVAKMMQASAPLGSTGNWRVFSRWFNELDLRLLIADGKEGNAGSLNGIVDDATVP